MWERKNYMGTGFIGTARKNVFSLKLKRLVSSAGHCVAENWNCIAQILLSDTDARLW